MGGESVGDDTGKFRNKNIGKVYHKKRDDTKRILDFMPFDILKDKLESVHKKISLNNVLR